MVTRQIPTTVITKTFCHLSKLLSSDISVISLTVVINNESSLVCVPLTWIFLKRREKRFKSCSRHIKSCSVRFCWLMNYRVLSIVQRHPKIKYQNIDPAYIGQTKNLLLDKNLQSKLVLVQNATKLVPIRSN